MSSLDFSLADYQVGLAAGGYAPPSALCPYYAVDPVLYHQHGTTKQRRGQLRQALDELRKRTGRDYFNKTYPLQARTLDFSSRSFPAYRFILPEVMTEDWLAIVDWGKYQRDHVLHQPLCGYIVLKLLEGDGAVPPLALPRGGSLLDACVDSILQWDKTAYIRDFLVRCGMHEDDPLIRCPHSPLSRKIWRIFFKEAAFVAAVFHDLGYPWQYAERLQGNLDGMNSPAIRQTRNAAEIVEVFGHRLLFHALQGYRIPDAACPSSWRERLLRLTEISLNGTHGLPGALGFLHLNDCVRRYPHAAQSPLHLLCVEWAAVAILMHDMGKVYWGEGASGEGTPENPFLRVGFDRDPLSAIVTLTDVIQDFERPTVSYGAVDVSTSPHSRDERVTLKYNGACAGTQLEIDACGVLTLRYRMQTDEMRAIKRTALLKEKREYFDAQYGYLDLSMLGITDVRMGAC
jgi:hypothetical protein